MLNVRSAPRTGRSGPPPAPDDRTARARIRDAAITCFAQDGVPGTSVREIARAAGVSPGLVIHHFGSKEALRAACDDHVCALIMDRKSDAIAQGSAMDPLAVARRLTDGPPVVRYLARTLVDGSPAVAALVDHLVANGEQLVQQSIAAGLMLPADDEFARSAVITVWSLGALVLHQHLDRLLDVDLIDDVVGSTRYLRAVVDVLASPAFTQLFRDRLLAGLAAGPPPAVVSPDPSLQEHLA
jgi:AcrR family transcriptional regulator